MLYTLVWILHVLVVIALIIMILVQRGRTGGLIEALGGVESIFGTKTGGFFVKATVGLSIAFFCTSLSLAYLSKEQHKSIMSQDAFKGIVSQQEPETKVPVTAVPASTLQADPTANKPAQPQPSEPAVAVNQ